MEGLGEMPSYVYCGRTWTNAKSCEVYKRHLLKKNHLGEYEMVTLREECPLIFQSKLPKKLKQT